MTFTHKSVCNRPMINETHLSYFNYLNDYTEFPLNFKQLYLSCFQWFHFLIIINRKWRAPLKTRKVKKIKLVDIVYCLSRFSFLLVGWRTNSSSKGEKNNNERYEISFIISQTETSPSTLNILTLKLFHALPFYSTQPISHTHKPCHLTDWTASESQNQ